jgi:DivIVA domain-containing protein
VNGETADFVALDSTHDPVNEVAGPEFPIVLRGYDRAAVDAYVAKVIELVAELHAVSSPRAAVRRALDRVGEQTATILQEAQKSADELTARSRARADERVQEGEQEAARLVADAEKRIRELDENTEALWRERMKLIDDTRHLGVRLEAIADDATAAFPPEPPAAAPEAEAEPEPKLTDAFPPPAAEEPAGPTPNGPPTEPFDAQAVVAEDDDAEPETAEQPAAREPAEGQKPNRA